MKKSKPESKARILRLSATQRSDVSTSEVTRDLFSATWHNYLDQVEMSAVKSRHTAKTVRNTIQNSDKRDTSMVSVRMFLQKP